MQSNDKKSQMLKVLRKRGFGTIARKIFMNDELTNEKELIGETFVEYTRTESGNILIYVDYKDIDEMKKCT